MRTRTSCALSIRRPPGRPSASNPQRKRSVSPVHSSRPWRGFRVRPSLCEMCAPASCPSGSVWLRRSNLPTQPGPEELEGNSFLPQKGHRGPRNGALSPPHTRIGGGGRFRFRRPGLVLGSGLCLSDRFPGGRGNSRRVSRTSRDPEQETGWEEAVPPQRGHGQRLPPRHRPWARPPQAGPSGLLAVMSQTLVVPVSWRPGRSPGASSFGRRNMAAHTAATLLVLLLCCWRGADLQPIRLLPGQSRGGVAAPLG